MYDPGNGLRYLVHFDDGGSGIRSRDEPLRPGDALFDSGGDYVVERVEPAPNPMSFAHRGQGVATNGEGRGVAPALMVCSVPVLHRSFTVCPE
jgi:hypothetical protein